MLLDNFLPVYDVSDAVATVVHADVRATWNALLATDLLEVGRRKPLVAMLGAIRILPDIFAHLVHGEVPPNRAGRLLLRDLATLPLENGGWVQLGARPYEEIAFGLVGKFWRPVIEFAPVPAAAFRDFAKPGFAKTVYSLSVRALNRKQTLLSGVMRTATTDQHARRWFRRYWTLGVGSGAHVLVNGLLEIARDEAEAAA